MILSYPIAVEPKSKLAFKLTFQNSLVKVDEAYEMTEIFSEGINEVFNIGNNTNVISTIEFVIHHKESLNIRIFNMSFSAPARSHYWDNPIN
jgi:hypothetical protein